MKRLLLVFVLIISACTSIKENVDLIVTNGTVYTVDANFATAEAFAVKAGKFVAVGSSKAITEKYVSKQLRLSRDYCRYKS